MNDYAYYKSMGICTYCHKENALPNRVYCGKCAKHISEYGQAHKAQRNKNNRDIMARRRQNGLCVTCGKPTNNGTYCNECAFIRNTKRKIIRMCKKRGTWTGRIFDEVSIRKICLGVLREWGII